LLSNAGAPLQYSDHQIGRSPQFHASACELPLEGIISKRADAPYSPGDRGLWVKVKCQNREEFVVVGWTDPEGSRPWLGALLLAYYDPDGRLVYAGRVGTGIDRAELGRRWRRLQPLAMPRCHSISPHLGRTASVHRSSSAACTGFGPSLLSRSNT
jgi:ATP-dependent DNA ligase